MRIYWTIKSANGIMSTRRWNNKEDAEAAAISLNRMSPHGWRAVMIVC